MGNVSADFTLLKHIITPRQRAQKLPVDVSRLEKIIREEIPQALSKQAPANFPELYFEFEQVYGQFHDFLLFDKLIGKNVVALGGSFSSGKSSFLNSLLAQRILPANIDPSTSVPTYVIQEAEESAWGINIFDVKLPLSFPDIKSIAHGFGREEVDEEGENPVDEITLGHLLQSLFVAVPTLPYSHIAFLDTPGYSKPDSDAFSVKTDERIARAQLNSSNAILWFVPADTGTISTDDIAFLKSLDHNIPKWIIVAKADKAPDKAAVEELKKKIRSVLEINGIAFEGIAAFSRRKNSQFDRKLIEENLRKLDDGKKQVDFAHQFKQLFVACHAYYEDEIHASRLQLSRLNQALTLSGDVPEVADCLSEMSTEVHKELEGLQDAEATLQKLQREFFAEIKFVADTVGIAMPEPSEIELRKDELTDPAALTKKLLQESQQAKAARLLKKLTAAMQKIDPTPGQKLPGGPLHKETLYNLLKEKIGG